MRFSLKWILAAMAYMAIAAAAFTQNTWVYADLLWAASLLAVVYTALVTAFARGRRQLIAAGFVAASLCFCACLNLGGADAVPTMRLLTAAGVGRQPTPSPAVQPRSVGEWMAMQRVDMESYRRAGNAVGMMLVGGLGCIVGLAAHRAVRREVQDETATMAPGH